jgi:hypothetical protein
MRAENGKDGVDGDVGGKRHTGLQPLFSHRKHGSFHTLSEREFGWCLSAVCCLLSPWRLSAVCYLLSAGGLCRRRVHVPGHDRGRLHVREREEVLEGKSVKWASKGVNRGKRG